MSPGIDGSTGRHSVEQLAWLWLVGTGSGAHRAGVLSNIPVGEHGPSSQKAQWAERLGALEVFGHLQKQLP